MLASRSPTEGRGGRTMGGALRDMSTKMMAALQSEAGAGAIDTEV